VLNRRTIAEAATRRTHEATIVPFLKLPENDTDKPYLIGSRCKNCGATYLASAWRAANASRPMQ